MPSHLLTRRALIEVALGGLATCILGGCVPQSAQPYSPQFLTIDSKSCLHLLLNQNWSYNPTYRWFQKDRCTLGNLNGHGVLALLGTPNDKGEIRLTQEALEQGHSVMGVAMACNMVEPTIVDDRAFFANVLDASGIDAKQVACQSGAAPSAPPKTIPALDPSFLVAFTSVGNKDVVYTATTDGIYSAAISYSYLDFYADLNGIAPTKDDVIAQPGPWDITLGP